MIVGVFGGLWAAQQSIQLSRCRCYPLPDLCNGPPPWTPDSLVLKTTNVTLSETAQNFRSFGLCGIVQKPIQRVLFIALSQITYWSRLCLGWCVEVSAWCVVAFFFVLCINISVWCRAIIRTVRGDADKSLARQEGNKLQRPNSGFIQRTPHEDQYTS